MREKQIVFRVLRLIVVLNVKCFLPIVRRLIFTHVPSPLEDVLGKFFNHQLKISQFHKDQATSLISKTLAPRRAPNTSASISPVQWSIASHHQRALFFFPDLALAFHRRFTKLRAPPAVTVRTTKRNDSHKLSV